MIRLILIGAVALAALELHGGTVSDADLAGVRQMVETGQWQRAGDVIARRLREPGLTDARREALRFQQERMRRMRLDFSKTRPEVLEAARRIVPDLDESLFSRWEQAGAVEFLEIDGRRWYFERAAGNLFRVNAEAKALKETHRPAVPAIPPRRLENLRAILAHADRSGEATNTPKRFRVNYRLSVKPGAVPAGELVRVWLPAPQTQARQRLVRGPTSEPAPHVCSPPTAAHATLYLERPAMALQPTTFNLTYEYLSSGFCQPVDPVMVRPVATNDPALASFLLERPPHILFDGEVRRLSHEIVADEPNPWQRARRIFQWVHEHIPWAGAREYSTIESLSRYALDHRWGDCGIQTMLFMTLCRLNGIPARWVSGWRTGPDKNMHDWCEIYIDPYGWLPADVSDGLVPSPAERERWFYLGGLDSYRLVVNSDYSQTLYPAKRHFRSETVDFQRGEVEWRGGNLYFDQWDYEFTVEELPTPTAALPPQAREQPRDSTK